MKMLHMHGRGIFCKVRKMNTLSESTPTEHLIRPVRRVVVLVTIIIIYVVVVGDGRPNHVEIIRITL
jgi:hypothetical protein